MGKPLIWNLIVYLVVLLVLTVSAAAEEGNDCAVAVNSAEDLKYKIVAIFSTLIVGVLGVCLPIFGLDLECSIFYSPVRHVGACVMGFNTVTYILPDATESLTSSCIGDFPWGGFCMTRIAARAAAILTLIETKSLASAFMYRSHLHIQENHNKIGQKLVTQFVELGIVFPSLLIGIALGACPSLSIIKPLIPAITFHQLFQGTVRGGYISKAKLELKKTLTMVILFSLTAPLGIGIGIGVSEIYFKNVPTTLIVSGSLSAAAAGILLFITAVIGSNLKPHSTFHMSEAFGFVFVLLMI